MSIDLSHHRLVGFADSSSHMSSSAAFRVFGRRHRATVGRGAEHRRAPLHLRHANRIDQKPVAAFRIDGGGTDGPR